MKVTVDKSELSGALAKVSPLAEKRSPMPILSHVLCEAKGDELSVSATDLETGMVCRVVCSVDEPGSVAVPGKKFFEVVRELPQGRLSLELGADQRLKIQAGESKFTMACMEASEFPVWQGFEKLKTGAVATKELVDWLDQSMYAAANSESRFNMNAVLFENRDEGTRLVATDGHRLAMVDTGTHMGVEEKALAPKKGLQELRRVLSGLKEDEVEIGFEDKNMVAQTPHFLLAIRLIRADYPDYNKPMPEWDKGPVILNRAEALKALRRVGILIEDVGRRVDLAFSEGSAEFVAKNSDLGEARDVITIENQGYELSSVYSVDYLAEAVSALDSEFLRVSWDGEIGILGITPGEENGAFALVMPMMKR